MYQPQEQKAEQVDHECQYRDCDHDCVVSLMTLDPSPAGQSVRKCDQFDLVGVGAAFSTPTCDLIRIKPKETNEQSAQDGDCDHILTPTELNLVNASGTEDASSRCSFCDAQPDSVSTLLCHRATNRVALLRRSARSNSGTGRSIGL